MIAPELMQQLIAWSQGQERVVLGIVGLPGAGKSTFTSWVQQQLGAAVALFPMDAFHLSNLQLRRLERLERKGAPDTFDIEGYLANLQRVKPHSYNIRSIFQLFTGRSKRQLLLKLQSNRK